VNWVAVGLSSDLRWGMAMPACIDDVDLAIWRTASGDVHAWGDRCPHRGMRLSQGFVRGETLSCIYHGWQYGNDGGCTYIPAHPKLIPPKSICATTYGCQDGDGLIWVAPKATTSAPPSLPDVVPVRSVPIQASLRDVAVFLGAPDAVVIDVSGVTCVLQSTGPAHCNVHVLTKQDRKTASRWIEAQRTQIELHAQTEMTPA
jgi:phenylpropionate dioxygenase-like ring-hydroxylating dioxygenase large terminal subunit